MVDQNREGKVSDLLVFDNVVKQKRKPDVPHPLIRTVHWLIVIVYKDTLETLELSTDFPITAIDLVEVSVTARGPLVNQPLNDQVYLTSVDPLMLEADHTLVFDDVKRILDRREVLR